MTMKVNSTTYVLFFLELFFLSSCTVFFLSQDSDSEDEAPRRALGRLKGRGEVAAPGSNVNPEDCKTQ